MILKTDLHIHSCLSPCASLAMSPGRIVREAVSRGIDILGLTDHNSAMNAEPFGTLCLKNGILPVFGIEAETREEIHILCLFETAEAARELGRLLYDRIPDFRNDPGRFGDQVYVDEEENILGEIEKMLSTAADIGLEELEEIVLAMEGLFIPAHIDRPVFSITSQLGFVPDGRYSGVEITGVDCSLYPEKYPRITGSDAHYPDDIGRRAFSITVEDKTFRGLREGLSLNAVTLPPLP